MIFRSRLIPFIWILPNLFFFTRPGLDFKGQIKQAKPHKSGSEKHQAYGNKNHCPQSRFRRENTSYYQDYSQNYPDCPVYTTNIRLHHFLPNSFIAETRSRRNMFRSFLIRIFPKVAPGVSIFETICDRDSVLAFLYRS